MELQIIDVNYFRLCHTSLYPFAASPERARPVLPRRPMDIHEPPAQRAHPLGQHGPFSPQPKRMSRRDYLRKTNGKVGTWRDQLPLRIVGEPKEDRMVTPHGFTNAWHQVAFKDRHTEISWLIQTQMRELAPLAQEFAANGLTAMSLSSSFDDDDLEAANICEKHLGTVPYDPSPAELSARLRTYEFDQFLQKCGQAAKIYAQRNAQGATEITTNDRRITPDQLVAELPKLRALHGERTLDEVENDRTRAYHYGKPVWANMTPEEQAAWTERAFQVREYLDAASTNKERDDWDSRVDDTPDGGPQELGLHNTDEFIARVRKTKGDITWIGYRRVPVVDQQVLTEPSEFELWPQIVGLS